MKRSLKIHNMSTEVSMAKCGVKDFYESLGWEKTPNGSYNDTAIFMDNRNVMQRYYAQAAKRAGTCFQRGGRYFLDAASGAKPCSDYSINFQWHVCIDFALCGLLEARNKLGNRGLYVMADITSLPFKNDVFEGILSAHTLYHMPESEQRKALSDLYRVMRLGSTCVILYRSSKKALTDWLVAWYRAAKRVAGTITGLRYLKRRFSCIRRTQADCQVGASPIDQHTSPLFFEPLPIHWFREQLASMGIKPEIRAYRFISKYFSETFIPNNALGRLFLSIIARFEEWFPRFFARTGSYFITIMIRKKQESYSE